MHNPLFFLKVRVQGLGSRYENELDTGIWAEARSVGERATKTQTQGNAKDKGQPPADFSTLQTLLSAGLFIHVYSLSQGLRTAEERAQGTH